MTHDAIFESSARGLREVGASVDERELVELIIRHGREEGELLERYEAVSKRSSPSMRYLVDLIVEDERRHHRVLGEIADAIAWGTVDGGSAGVPRPGPHDAEADAALLVETEALLAAEKRDRVELRRLRRRLRRYTGTMWPLLIDVMLADTEKHIRILEFTRPAAHTDPAPRHAVTRRHPMPRHVAGCVSRPRRRCRAAPGCWTRSSRWPRR